MKAMKTTVVKRPAAKAAAMKAMKAKVAKKKAKAPKVVGKKVPKVVGKEVPKVAKKGKAVVAEVPKVAKKGKAVVAFIVPKDGKKPKARFGRIYWSKSKMAWRVYLRKEDAVEVSVHLGCDPDTAEKSHIQKQWGKCLKAIERDPRPIS